MTKNVSLRAQLAAFKEGNLMDSDGTVNTFCSNFFDWFCRDHALEDKARKLFPRVKTFVEKMGVNLDTTYCTFKNNCPANGSLYDDFRICDRETGYVIWTVIPKCGHSGQAEVWGTINGFQDAYRTGDTLTKIYETLG
jgi:hypothetical protein